MAQLLHGSVRLIVGVIPIGTITDPVACLDDGEQDSVATEISFGSLETDTTTPTNGRQLSTTPSFSLLQSPCNEQWAANRRITEIVDRSNDAFAVRQVLSIGRVRHAVAGNYMRTFS